MQEFVRCRSLLLAACVFVVSAAAAAAQEWQASGEGSDVQAFYTQAGRPAGIQFACVPGGVVQTLVVGNGALFPEGRDLTLVLTVDGLARAMTGRAEPEPQGTGSRFVRSDPVADVTDLLASLKRGRDLEVSSPAGHFRVPLTGSGKAIARLESGCRP